MIKYRFTTQIQREQIHVDFPGKLSRRWLGRIYTLHRFSSVFGGAKAVTLIMSWYNRAKPLLGNVMEII